MQTVYYKNGKSASLHSVDAGDQVRHGCARYEPWPVAAKAPKAAPAEPVAVPFDLKSINGVGGETADTLVAAELGSEEALRGVTEDKLKGLGIHPKAVGAILRWQAGE